VFTRASRETLTMIVGCIAGSAILYLWSPGLLLSSYGYLVFGGALLGAILTLLVEFRRGISPAKSLIGIVIVVLFAVAFTYGPVFYLQSLMASGQPLFNFGP
jgi:hypothetical protein